MHLKWRRLSFESISYSEAFAHVPERFYSSFVANPLSRDIDVPSTLLSGERKRLSKEMFRVPSMKASRYRGVAYWSCIHCVLLMRMQETASNSTKKNVAFVCLHSMKPHVLHGMCCITASYSVLLLQLCANNMLHVGVLRDCNNLSCHVPLHIFQCFLIGIIKLGYRRYVLSRISVCIEIEK